MIEQKRLQSHPPICTVPEEQKEKIMEIAMRAGHILLENGAEISRVEETITGSAVITGLNPPIPLY